MKIKLLIIGIASGSAMSAVAMAQQQAVLLYPYYSAGGEPAFKKRPLQPRSDDFVLTLEAAPYIPFEAFDISRDMAVDNGYDAHGKGRKQRNKNYRGNVKNHTRYQPPAPPTSNRRRLMRQFGHL